MSSALTGTLAGQTSTRNLGQAAGLTDAQVGNAMRLVTLDKIQPPPDGLSQAALAKFYLDAWLDEMVRYSVQEARRNSIRERAAQQRAIETAADADAAL